jgi:hypothetical protein
VASSLGSLGDVQAHEIPEARIGGERVERFKALFVRGLAKQSVLALHGPVSSPLAGVGSSAGIGSSDTRDREVPNPVVDRRSRQSQPVGELVNRELALEPQRAGLLAQIGWMCRIERTFA